VISSPDWKRREETASTSVFVDGKLYAGWAQQFEILRDFPDATAIWRSAQLAPWAVRARWCFEKIPKKRDVDLSRIHRRRPTTRILDLAHALADSGAEHFEAVRTH